MSTRLNRFLREIHLRKFIASLQLWIDPTRDALRGDPRFRQFNAGGSSTGQFIQNR